MTSPYGTALRPWPKSGYFFNYESVFASCFEVASDRYFMCVEPSGDAEELWAWQFGCFSWTPDGDLWERYGRGTSTSRARAETACREASSAFIQRVAAL